jgi:large repetitive protein
MIGVLIPMALGVEGCCCGDECATGTDGGSSTASIAFEYPRNGNVLTPSDDIDGNIANGIQIDVAIRYSGDASGTITLSSDQFSNGITASVTNGMSTFESVTIAASEAGTENTLTIGDGTMSRTIKVTGNGTAVTDSCSFTAPDADAVLSEDANSSEDGFQFNATVACTGSGVAAGQTVTFNAGSTDATGTIDADGNATAQVTAPSGAITTTATLADSEGTTLATATQNNTVSLPNACNATITSPTEGTIYSASDADDNSLVVGFQKSVSLTTGDSSNCAGADVTVTAGGTDFTGTADNAGAASIEVNLPEGAVTIVAVVTNVAGPGTSDTVNVVVDRTAPEISITSPVDTQAFNPGSDVSLTGSITGFTSGSYTVDCTGGDAGMTSQGGTIASANFNVTLEDLDGTACTISITASDGVNETTASVGITFQDLAGPQVSSITVVDDANGDDLLTLAESGDAQGAAQSDITVVFSPSAPLDDGQTVFMTVTGQGTALQATSSGNSATFADVLLPEGGVSFTVTDDTVDASNNPLDPEFSSSITVTTIPTSVITLTSPEDGRVYGPSDDADMDFANGLTIQLTGTVANSTETSYTLTCVDNSSDTGAADGGTDDAGSGSGSSDGGAADGGTTPSGTFVQSGTITDASFDIALTDIDQPDCTLEVNATDGVNPVVETQTFSIGNVALSLTLSGDADMNDFYTASEDTDPGTATDMDVSVSLLASFVGGTYTGRADVYSCGAGTCDDGDEALVNAFQLGALTSSVATVGTVTVPYGDSVTYEVRGFAVPFVGDDEGPATASFVVDTEGPGLTWQAPLDGQALNSVNDTSFATPGFQVFIAVDATGMVAGSTVTFTLTHETDGVMDPAPTCTVEGTLVCRRQDIDLIDGNWTAVATGSDAAGNVGTSETRNFSVDATGPQVESIVVADDANTDDTLNLAESGDATGSASSDVTVTFTDALPIEDGLTVTLEVTGAADQTASSSGNAVTFTAVPLAEGIVDLTVSAVDAANNGIVTDGSESASITVDTVAPTISIGAPTAATLLAADDVDTVTADLQIDITVLTNAASGQTVELFDNAASLGTAASDGTAAAFSSVTLTQGTRNLTATVSDAAGNSSTSAAYGPLVDSIAPTLRITSPAHQSVQNDTPPVAVSFDVAHTGLAATDTICLTSDVEGADFACAAAGTNSESGEETTTIAAEFNQEATHTIVVNAADANTNPGVVSAEGANPVDGSIEVAVVTGNFTVSVSAPADNGGTRTIGNAEVSGGNVTVTVAVPNDTGVPAATATLSIGGTCETSTMIVCSGPDGTECPVGEACEGEFEDTAAVAGQAATFTVAVTEFQNATNPHFGVTVASAAPKTGSTGVLDFAVDLGDPTVTITSPASPATVGLNDDVNAVTAGVQINLALDVTNCENGTITVTAPGTPAPTGDMVSIDASGTESGNLEVTVEGGDDQMWTVTCTDSVGNAGTSTAIEIDADVTAPAAISDLALSVPAGEAKQGTVDITFTAPGDDDATGTATIEIVASKTDFSGLSDTAFDTAFDAAVAADFATYGQPGMDRRVVELTGTGGGIAVNEQATGLAFDSTNAGGQTWTIAVRAKDEAGNASRDSAEVTFTTSSVALTGAAKSFGRGSHSNGDLNGDGKDDLVISNFSEPADGQSCDTIILSADCAGAIRVYAGLDDLSGLTTTKTLGGLADQAWLGFGIAIADLNGDGKDDIVATAINTTNFNGKLLIYYGNDTCNGGGVCTDPVNPLTDNPDMVDAPITINFDNLLLGAENLIRLGDVNGDTREDIGITSFGGGGTESRFHILFGSATKPADNVNLTDNAPGATYAYLEDINGYNIKYAAAMGDLNDDPIGGVLDLDDFAITVNDAASSFVLVVDGRQLWPDPATSGINVGCNGVCAGNASDHDLDLSDILTCSGDACGKALAGADINGDGELDLLVNDAIVGTTNEVSERVRVYLADDDTGVLGVTDMSGEQQMTYSLNPPQFVQLSYASVVNAGDVNGDGYDDTFFSTRTVGADQSQFQLFLGGIYDETTGLTGDPLSRTTPDATYLQAQSFEAHGITCGDLNGDGKNELCYGGPEGNIMIVRY